MNIPFSGCVLVAASGLALAGSPLFAEDASGTAIEISGVISVEAKGNTFKACGYDKDPIALWPPNAAASLVEQAKRESKSHWGELSEPYVYARVSLTYVHDANLRKTCIGSLRGVSQCATLGPKFILYHQGSLASCTFQ